MECITAAVPCELIANSKLLILKPLFLLIQITYYKKCVKIFVFNKKFKYILKIIRKYSSKVA